MNNYCYRSLEQKNQTKAESTGWRQTFYYPGGGTYHGYWLNSQHHRFGVKESKKHLIYDGQWSRGKRHGYGMMRRRLEDGTMERIYMGEWYDDMKSGEGKQFYEDGVYYGWWKNNRRHGLGIKWFKNGNIFMGEWQADAYHGLGVMFYANGNRYEGNFARGLKSSEGTFYHNRTGQVQKGMWESDICKVSLMQDEYRNQAEQPTANPIPKLQIANPSDFIRDLFGKYKNQTNKPSKSLQELICLNFNRKMNSYAKLQPKYATTSEIPAFDVYFSSTCKKE
ncbi:MORN repeat-containing protein 3 [Lucilia cuprina]|nr:MORN repeat-containing protein 3 [Lucilia cuprina]